MKLPLASAIALSVLPLVAAPDPALRATVAQKLAADYAALDALYRDFHANPELSLM